MGEEMVLYTERRFYFQVLTVMEEVPEGLDS
jgi:hypothetical protein